MDTLELQEELEPPTHVRDISDMEFWCKALSIDHFNRFDRKRMRNSRCSHEMNLSFNDLAQRLMCSSNEYRISDLWIHCISGDQQEGVFVKDLDRKVKVLGIRLFHLTEGEIRFIYVPLMEEIDNPLEYLKEIIDANVGPYTWRENGSRSMYSGLPSNKFKSSVEQ